MESNADARQDTPVDALVRRLAPRAQIAFRGHPEDGWHVDISGHGHMPFHVVGGGGAWLHINERTPQEIRAGSVVVLPWDCAHVLSSADTRKTRFGKRVLPNRQAGDGTTLICGDLQIDPATRRMLRGTLPEVLVVATDAAPLDHLSQCLFAEAARDTDDSDPLLLRVVETLLLFVLHAGLTRHAAPNTGLPAAFTHPQLHPALKAMLNKPEHPWTVAELANTANLSRSGFARHFREAIGCGPIDLLTEWRMHHARHLLHVEGFCVPEVAERCGYRSEAAFARAFKRVIGYGPGEARRRD